MKATGIVRRIDDLGRVVVPKEIRRTMRIREGQAMEIFTGREGEIVLKKYSPIEEMTDCAAECAKAMATVCGHLVCISDHEQIVAASGPEQKNYQGKTISAELEQAMAERRLVDAPSGSRELLPVTGDGKTEGPQIIVPILSAGDVLGAVMILGKTPDISFGKTEMSLAKAAALFLGNRTEA